MKKLRTVSVLVVFLFTMLFGACGFAQENTGVMPRYVYTADIQASLSFSGGVAICTGRVTPEDDYDCSIIVTLYKQTANGWEYITDWSASATDGGTASVTGPIYVGKGTFRVVAMGVIQGGLEYAARTVVATN